MSLVSAVEVIKNDDLVASITEKKNDNDVAVFSIRKNVAVVRYDGEIERGVIRLATFDHLADIKFVIDEDELYETVITVQELPKDFLVTLVRYNENDDYREIYTL